MKINIGNIRNFCIIAHIDHGKSTLADRLLELTNTVPERLMKKQLLDQMELEQERGITIKLQPAHMHYNDHILNLIDTPGHVDFTYEVSRSLAACEGAVLLVDATQGVQAQTLANLYLALEHDLVIVPVINKIDLPAAKVEETKEEIINLIGCTEEEIISISAKTGEGVKDVLDKIIEKIPHPKASNSNNLKALIFDSVFDEYKGVVAYIRVFSGELKKGDKIKFIATDTKAEVLEIGVFVPSRVAKDSLESGSIGYVVTGLKEVEQCQVGDTIATVDDLKALHGYKKVIPMVYAGLFPKEGNDFAKLRMAMEKLKLNDASLIYETEHSVALGFGFRCGFLGLLHLDIVQERIRREFNLDVIVTAPSVAYQVEIRAGIKEIKKELSIGNIKKVKVPKEGFFTIHTPSDLPDPSQIQVIREPYVKADVITPEEYLGSVMSLMQDKKGEYINTEYLSAKGSQKQRVLLHYELPLASILVDFYDTLKSVTSGFASLNYELIGYRDADVGKMDILVAEQPVEALSVMVYKDSAYTTAKKIVLALKKEIPKQMFEIKIQAAIGGKVIASERISALRKDVTAKLYGGDVTRKRKLLEKQKAGKKRLKAGGSVDIPAKAFLAVLKR